jgi:hypothetical protein
LAVEHAEKAVDHHRPVEACLVQRARSVSHAEAFGGLLAKVYDGLREEVDAVRGDQTECVASVDERTVGGGPLRPDDG